MQKNNLMTYVILAAYVRRFAFGAAFAALPLYYEEGLYSFLGALGVIVVAWLFFVLPVWIDSLRGEFD